MKKPFGESETQDKKEPVIQYFSNRIPDIPTILDFFKEVYNKEEKPFKVSMSIGYIYQIPVGDANSFDASIYLDSEFYDKHGNIIYYDEKNPFKGYITREDLDEYEYISGLGRIQKWIDKKHVFNPNDPTDTFYNKDGEIEDIEKIINRNVSDVDYKFQMPDVNFGEYPKIITNEKNLKEYLEHINKYLSEDVYKFYEDQTERSSSLDLKIAIISISFNVYRLQSSTGKLPLLDKFIKNKFLFAYNEDNNLCFFAAVASLKARIKPNIKFNHNHATQQARKLYKEYFNIDDRSIIGKESELT
jgi:hypothetical protein